MINLEKIFQYILGFMSKKISMFVKYANGSNIHN